MSGSVGAGKKNNPDRPRDETREKTRFFVCVSVCVLFRPSLADPSCWHLGFYFVLALSLSSLFSLGLTLRLAVPTPRGT